MFWQHTRSSQCLKCLFKQILNCIIYNHQKYLMTFSVLFSNVPTDIQEAASNNNGKAAHSAWRNYDDFNEYFWFSFFLVVYLILSIIIRWWCFYLCRTCRSPSCLELKWPLKDDSSFLLKPKKWKRVNPKCYSFLSHSISVDCGYLAE